MPEKPIIPVYLNQRIVFDLLAMLEGGICQVTRVASAERKTEQDERRYGADFGLSKALASLLSINVSGERKRAAGTEETQQKDEERIHTPASLFYRLRNQLQGEGLLKVLSGSEGPKEHDLVEFGAAMVRNPLVQTMDSFVSLMEMAILFDDQGTIGKGQHRGQSQRENERIVKQMTGFNEKLKSGDTVDMVAQEIAGGHRAVVTVETEYLNDPAMADLVDGRFIVVGKVIRTVPSGEAISLIRKSALTMMPKSILEGMMGSLAQLSETQGFNLPDLSWELPGPAFQVIPIAIFA
jgi:hypothetical protein